MYDCYLGIIGMFFLHIYYLPTRIMWEMASNTFIVSDFL